MDLLFVSTKNKKHHRNDHRHAFGNSWKKTAHYKKRQSTAPSTSVPAGSRIVNLEELQEYSQQLLTHSAQCDGSVLVKGEYRQGLASIISWQCEKYSQSIVLESTRGPCGRSQWERNLAAVRSEMATGGRHSRLEESIGTLGVPVMSKASFISTAISEAIFS